MSALSQCRQSTLSEQRWVNIKAQSIESQPYNPSQAVSVMARRPVMKYWLNWGEISGKAGTSEELTALLAKYARKGLLIACGRLTVEFNYGPEGKTVAKDELTKQFINRLFPSDIVAKVNKAFEHDRVIFFQGQLRYIAAAVTRLPYVENLPEIENHEIGELLLRAAELMVFKAPKPANPMDALANTIVEFVPFYEIDPPTDPLDQLMRFYIMLTVNIPRLASKGPLKFDVAAEFEKVFGFTLGDYENFMFSLLLHAMLERENRQANIDPPSPVGPYWLKTTTLSEETIHKVLATVSFSPGTPRLVCPIFCTSEIVSVAQLSLLIDSRSRGCGEVGSA